MILASRDIVESVDKAWYILGGVSLVLFVGIISVLIIFTLRYHHTRHPDAEHIPGNLRLEIVWTILPTLLSVWLFFVGLEGFSLMRNPPEGAYEIDVTARQWAWEFTYQDGVTSSELYVPINTPVKLNLSTPIDDVVHSFYLPDFRVKEDCVPGKPGYLWFEADRLTGDNPHNIFCAEFCGKDHSRMITVMHVLPKEGFEEWLDAKVAERYLPVDAAVALNPASEEFNLDATKAMFGTYCASCHGAQGQGGLVEGARDFRSLTGWKRGPKLTDIYTTLSKGIEGTQMRAFSNLPPWQRFALAHYVRSFYTGSEQPQDTLAEMQKFVTDNKLDDPPKVSRSFNINEAMEAVAKDRTR
jgi:cytochrome c oxidase subunit II